MVGFVDLREVPLAEEISELEDVVLDFFVDWLVGDRPVFTLDHEINCKYFPDKNIKNMQPKYHNNNL